MIPRIAREYTPAPSLFPPWVSTAAIILVFAVFLALSCLFVLAIINILIAFSQEGLS